MGLEPRSPILFTLDQLLLHLRRSRRLNTWPVLVGMSYHRGRGRGQEPSSGFRGRGDYRGRGDRGIGGGGGGGRGDRGGRGSGFRGDRGGGFRGSSRGGIFLPNEPATLDARLTDANQDSLIASFKSLTVNTGDLPLRPGFGTAGAPVTLRSNFFPIKLPKGPLQEYDVTIEPEPKGRRTYRRIFQLAEVTPQWVQYGLRGKVAHDHTSKLIAATKLPQPMTIPVLYSEEDQDASRPGGKTYTLTIKFARELEMESLLEYLSGRPQYRGYDPLPVISALNLILAAFPNRTSAGGGVLVGRNRFFFPTAAQPVSLGGGLEAWRGFYSSVRPTFNQLMVNVNVCTTAFYVPGNLADAMMAFRDASYNARPNAFVKGVRIEAKHLGYRKTVKALTKVDARTHKFDSEFGTVTVEQYFKKKYQITLRYPQIPLVDVGGTKQVFLPPEVCEILPGQAFKGKLTDEHTANMIRAACQPPVVNAQAIADKGLSLLGFQQSTQQGNPLAQFGISVGNQMAVVPGRILPPPGIKYASGSPQVDDRASWNLRSVRFAVGRELSNWAVVVLRDGNEGDFDGARDPELRQVVRGLADMCRTSGMVVDKKEPTFAEARLPPRNPQDPLREQAISIIEATLKTIRPKPNLVIFMLSNGDKHIYSGIKALCDTRLDVATLCVHSNKIRKERGQIQFFANVALKINMKLGGINHAIEGRSMAWLQQVPTMLVGMDVTHPGFGSISGTPSIAAVVASVDSTFGQYPASMEMQKGKKEMITSLANMMVERLSTFRNRNKRLPERIIVYRDGVSEGQLPIVVGEELPEIKASFRKFDSPKGPYQPKLTIIICGKRHHTRFYPTSLGHADQQGNPKPGTVIDRGVTAVYDFDFFLQAHGGLQGTTRPTHYYVVHDEIRFKADELQELTNAVSYTFARATKAVSLVSPAYYADLACDRGRRYIHKLMQGVEREVTSSSSEEQVMNEAKRLWSGGVGKTLRETMFYL